MTLEFPRLIAQLVMVATTRLRSAGVDTPRLDAEMLLCFVIAAERTFLIAHPDACVDEPQRTRFESLVRRRCEREPLPYLTGSQPFLDFSVTVAPGVLIPRPETELLVEVALSCLPPNRHPVLVVDVGVGSGAVTIGVARGRSDVRVAAIDCSEAALCIAADNVSRLDLRERVDLFCGDLLSAAPRKWLGSVDLVVSNPPYVPTALLRELPPEVGFYEPRIALDGGSDGLDVVRRLALQAMAWLRPTGALVVEIGEGQGPAVREVLANAGYIEPVIRLDYAGIDRIAFAIKPDLSR